MLRGLYTTVFTLAVASLFGCKGASVVEKPVSQPKPATPSTLAQSVLDFKGEKKVEPFRNGTEHTIPESEFSRFTFTAVHTPGGPVTYRDQNPAGWSPGDRLQYSVQHAPGPGDGSWFRKYQDECQPDGSTRTKTSDRNYGMWWNLSRLLETRPSDFQHIARHHQDARTFNQRAIESQPSPEPQ
ncbi:hypothetical protein CMO91_03020 [Candidatus Woesearchaeota archaeon]|nr:hypothetical protein [Candidatus Woesearchaeota archaeon]|tara:strand:+ start:387 stop:938 length:552 start_codon:yes stop_codon:yes gene_type:complete